MHILRISGLLPLLALLSSLCSANLVGLPISARDVASLGISIGKTLGAAKSGIDSRSVAWLNKIPGIVSFPKITRKAGDIINWMHRRAPSAYIEPRPVHMVPYWIPTNDSLGAMTWSDTDWTGASGSNAQCRSLVNTNWWEHGPDSSVPAGPVFKTGKYDRSWCAEAIGKFRKNTVYATNMDTLSRVTYLGRAEIMPFGSSTESVLTGCAATWGCEVQDEGVTMMWGYDILGMFHQLNDDPKMDICGKADFAGNGCWVSLNVCRNEDDTGQYIPCMETFPSLDAATGFFDPERLTETGNSPYVLPGKLNSLDDKQVAWRADLETNRLKQAYAVFQQYWGINLADPATELMEARVEPGDDWEVVSTDETSDSNPIPP